MAKTKYIFVTGGVLSGLGKGITAASVGKILQARGFKVSLQKCDPYLNKDAGTLNPGEHGEVFVTEDGAETDLDIGHYERFLGKNFTGKSSLMAGLVFQNVLSAERKGEYLGKTVQIIPHIISEIQRLIKDAGERSDIHIVEIGGTVGDYEGLHFMEAIRQMKRIVSPENVLYIHVVFLPYLSTSGEVKTKPAQNSVRDLKELGITPDIICARSDYPVSEDLIEKISLYCDVESEAIIPLPTAKTIYEVPLMIEDYKAGDLIVKKLLLPKRKPRLKQWRNIVEKIKLLSPKKYLKIAIIAKYLSNKDTYFSVVEAIKAAGWMNNIKIDIVFFDSEYLEKKGPSLLKGISGIVVPGGFGFRGIEGKILAVKYARENKIPYLGLCLGMQVAVVEFARNVANLKGAHSTEFNPKTKYPVIYIMPSQRGLKNKGGTMRLGAWPCILNEDSISFKAYKKKRISERHRHRYEFNLKYKEILEKFGLRIGGTSPDKKLVEIIEIKNHPFFVGVQFHPEFKSRPDNPHPLFLEFVKNCLNQKRTQK